MTAGDVETFPEDGHWKTKIAGTDPVLGIDETREAAVERGRRMATTLRVAHVVKGPDGIPEEHTAFPYQSQIA